MRIHALAAVFGVLSSSPVVRATDVTTMDNASIDELLKDFRPPETVFPDNDPWALPLVKGCPKSCAEAGASSANWTQLYNRDHLSNCNQPLLFALNVNNKPSQYTTIRACAATPGAASNARRSTGARDGEGASAEQETLASDSTTPAFATFCGAAKSTAKLAIRAGPNTLADAVRSDAADAAVLLASRLASDAACGYTLLFARSGTAVAGLYAGADVVKDSAAQMISKYADALRSGSQSLEVCDAASKGSHTLGVFAVGDVSELDEAQKALQSWSRGECLSSEGVRVLDERTELGLLRSTAAANSTVPSGHESRSVEARGDCRTWQVDDGDGCASLASHCGISGADFTKYNDPSICSSLKKGQYVCCSSGSLPDMRPKPGSDGSCATTAIHSGDGCWSITSRFGITESDLNDFNKNTWGWAGCGALQQDQVICISKGNPPMPAPVNGMVCGPQVTGTSKPAGDITADRLALLNQCPLNACCSGWGFCGTTAEFCTKSPADTGNPGTHKPGTSSCISNCNMDIVHSSAPASFMKIGYFEGYGINRACNRVDIRDIDPSKYTHIHFAFATVTADTFQVDMGPTANQFHYFKQISGPKKILSFGGWTFSTDPATYGIFRSGVTAEHRDTMAKNIADFIVSNNLDGVDIDWEYPAAPDIPGIPAADPHEGANYFLFLVALKKYLPAGKTVSFAAPASYWYLKGFPIAAISIFVDYIVYMTYDLHGQWDFKNKWSDPGCPDGNCLRSHINMTETLNALSMITKAGVPSNKVVVGVASYGRSFKMSSAGCTGPMCTFLGPESQAAKGKCTGTAGYISKTEIDDIIKNNPTAKTFKDGSLSDILVYDDTEWVAYMSDQNKATRTTLFKVFSFLGTSDWAIDLDGEKSALPPTGPLSWYDPAGDGFKGPGGSAQIKLHNTCKNKGREDMLEEAWYEAGLLAKGMMQWSRKNKYQAAMDAYMGPQSQKTPWFTDFIWNNIRNHYNIHFGETPHPDDPPRALINIWMFCDESTVPDDIRKANTVRCSKSKTEIVSAATYRFPSRGTSQYYILFCPPFFDAQPGVRPYNTLTELSEWGDEHEDFRLYIDDWATKVRAVTMFHEVVHFQDVSNPQCGSREYYAPKASIGYARRTKDNQGFDKNVRNAHSWTLVAVATYMMQRWPSIGVPWPKGLDGRPQKRSLVSTDDEDGVLQFWGRDDTGNCTDSGAGGAAPSPGCDPHDPAGGPGPAGGCDPGNCGDKGTPGGPGTGPSNPNFPGDDQLLHDYGISDQSGAGGPGGAPMREPGEIDDAPPDSGNFDPAQVDPADFFWMNLR